MMVIEFGASAPLTTVAVPWELSDDEEIAVGGVSNCAESVRTW